MGRSGQWLIGMRHGLVATAGPAAAVAGKPWLIRGLSAMGCLAPSLLSPAHSLACTHSAGGGPAVQPAAVVPTAATCLFPAELLQLHTAQVVDLLCISDAEATRALRYYKWDVSKLQVMGFIATHVGR